MAKLDKRRYEGIIPAMITPYTVEGKISEEVTRKLVRHLRNQGIAGLYLSGTTGEGFLQTIEERQHLLEIVLDEVKGAIPVIAQVGALDTATSIKLTKHAAQVGADAVSSVAPFFYKAGPKEIRAHYLDIASAAEIPLIIYHFPELTGVDSSTEFYAELAQTDGIAGVKFTSKDTFELQQLIAACGNDFLVFNGPDECCLAGLAVGCCGAIGSTYNIMADTFVTLYQRFQSGDLVGARKMQYEANTVIKELLKYNFIAFEREVLRLQGIDTGQPRKPLQQLTDEQRLAIRTFAETMPLLNVVPKSAGRV